jgi:hypothetical protein
VRVAAKSNLTIDGEQKKLATQASPAKSEIELSAK